MMKGRPKMVTKRKVILITDGDEYAKRAVEHVAKEIGEGVSPCPKVIHHDIRAWS